MPTDRKVSRHVTSTEQINDIDALTVAVVPEDWSEVDRRAVDTVRVLAADAVQKVGNGHPGTAMSLAPLAYTLFQRVMRHDPADPHWVGRDRFVLSCGHSSLTLYIQLYLAGFGLELDDLKALRTWGSLTPGHPEYHHTKGVEITTGPLGQGLASAVGMAMASRREPARPVHLRERPSPEGAQAMWTLSGFADEIDPDLQIQCDVLTELGIGYVEFRSAWEVNVLDLSDEQVDEAARILSANNLSISSIGSPIGKINIEDDFDEHLIRMDRALNLAHRLKAPYIRIFSFFLRPDQRPEDHRDEVIRRMRVLTEMAQAAEVVLLHENEKEIFGDVPGRVLDIVQSVNLPSLKLAWDAANYVQVGVTPFTAGVPDTAAAHRLHPDQGRRHGQR